MGSVQHFADLSEVFEFDELSLNYHDGPLSGWLRRRADGAWFGFACQTVVAGLVWHWTLVRAQSACDLRSLFERAIAEPDGEWWSVVEDGRGVAPTCSLVVVSTRLARPVVIPALVNVEPHPTQR